MKTHVASVVGLAMFAMAASVGSAAAAPAPASTEETVIAKVPFAFRVGATELPAGTYVAHPLDDESSTIAIEDIDGHQVALVMAQTQQQIDGPASPEMVFKKLDNHFYLARVVQWDGETRDIVPTPKQAKAEAIAAEAAASHP